MEISPLSLDTDSIFFNPLDKYKASEELLQIVKTIIDDYQINYKISRDRIYYVFSYDLETFPNEGWKIHISACYWNCIPILEKTAEYCVHKHLNFKMYLDTKTVFHMNEKTANRSHSGKFITIYMSNESDLILHLMNLKTLLSEFDGPYILTDRRYHGIIFYRYGLFRMNKKAVIKNPENDSEIFIDDHQPFYHLPSWINDPIPIKDDSDEDDSLFHNRYLIEAALRFTNAGGTYLAHDSVSNSKVIIKEARPFTCQFGDKMDSVDLKNNEIEILKKLSDVEFVPNLIDSFFEWEHFYIVVNFIEGKTIKEFSSQNNPLIVPNTNNNLSKYYYDMLIVLRETLVVTNNIHKNSIAIGDISDTNILFNGENIFLIDFDGSIDMTTNSKKYVFNTVKFNTYKSDKSNLYVKDYVLIGTLIYSMLINPVSPEIDDNFINRIGVFLHEKYSLPKILTDALSNLVSGKYSDKNIQSLIDKIDRYLTIYNPNISIEQNDIYYLQNELSHTIIKHMTTNLDTLYSPLIKGGHLSFKYGQLGIIYSLQKYHLLSKTEQFEIINYLLLNYKYEDLSINTGLSGFLLTLLEFDSKDVKETIYKYLETVLFPYINSEINMSTREVSIGTGLAGIGLVLIRLYDRFKGSEILNYINMIYEFLISIKEDLMLLENTGLEYGLTGIAYFIIEYYKIKQEDSIYYFGESLLLNDLKCGIFQNEGLVFPYEKDNNSILFPYFSYGTSGVLFVLIEYLSVKKNIALHNYLTPLINGLKVSNSVHLGLEKGLVGILLGLVKAHKAHYIDKNEIIKMIKNIDVYLVDNPDEGILMPGYGMIKFSNDLATGSSGLLYVLNTLLLD